MLLQRLSFSFPLLSSFISPELMPLFPSFMVDSNFSLNQFLCFLGPFLLSLLLFRV
ncbi:hypothetical protein RchiOBHm_Chr7g0212071 [Rosa chinensis]|uniref:Uncharacterized protein n=1 Tax=Rosa chinensis TaxID=74649 RepID=A0A2P6PAM0_ROSCH|nr:hypothetical protein RchiOBHm_Chr7g0212071 [Rosa chinensis]